MIEITVFTKNGGPLTKQLSLGADGVVVSDASLCALARGKAKRVRISGLDDLARLIEKLETNQGFVLGAMRDGLDDEITIATQDAIDKGSAASGAISRTAANFNYRKGKPALVLLDFDTKGMPLEVKERIAALGGFYPALVSVLPEFGTAGHLIRASTSAGLIRTDTGQVVGGSDGRHVYVLIKDGTDAVRFLSALHERCWSAGLGWYYIDVAGKHLERSIIDRMVGQPERLAFEGPPVVEPPLKQDAVARRPVVTSGDVIDSATACPPLTAAEKKMLAGLQSKEKAASQPEADRLKGVYITNRLDELVKRTGVTVDAARVVIEKQIQGILSASLLLPFDDGTLAGKTVGDVLADPKLYDGKTLADPIEGVSYGRGKAKVMIGRDGVPFINSFAHGGARYQLIHESDVEIEQLSRLPLIEYDQQRNQAAKARGIRVSMLDKLVDAARKRAEKAEKADAARQQVEGGNTTEFEQINEKFALVLSGNNASVMMFEGGGNKFRLLQVGAFRQWFSNEWITIGKKVLTIGEYWLSHPRRRQFEGIEFAPAGNGSPGYYNLWQGFTVEPKQGDCSKFLAHLKNNVASGDEETYQWILGWWAQIFKQPAIKTGTALVLRGEFGTGKSKVGEVFEAILRDHFMTVSSPRYITGNFNAHMASLLVLHADEAFWAGDKESVGPLRNLVTALSTPIEYKRIDPIYIKNFVRLFITGNPDWMIPAGFKERRWAIFDMGTGSIQDHAYFAAIDEEMNNGGREALLHHLLEFDLTKVNLRQIPKTAALLEQQIESMTPEQSWWLDTLMNGALPHKPYGVADERTCAKVDLHQRYIQHAQLTGVNRRSAVTKLGIFLTKKLGIALKTTRPLVNKEQVPCYQFPPLQECRAKFAEKLGQPVDWGHGWETETWQHYHHPDRM